MDMTSVKDTLRVRGFENINGSHGDAGVHD